MRVFYYALFGFISIVVVGFLYPNLYSRTDWNPYVVWLAAVSANTFLLYGLDKLLSKVDGPRTPEALLHLLALLGGFPGGWLGMFVFRHKTNLRKHLPIWGFLALGTLAHAALAYYWLVLGGW